MFFIFPIVFTSYFLGLSLNFQNLSLNFQIRSTTVLTHVASKAPMIVFLFFSFFFLFSIFVSYLECTPFLLFFSCLFVFMYLFIALILKFFCTKLSPHTWPAKPQYPQKHLYTSLGSARVFYYIYIYIFIYIYIYSRSTCIPH